jgi:hypothetical protein
MRLPQFQHRSLMNQRQPLPQEKPFTTQQKQREMLQPKHLQMLHAKHWIVRLKNQHLSVLDKQEQVPQVGVQMGLILQKAHVILRKIAQHISKQQLDQVPLLQKRLLMVAKQVTQILLYAMLLLLTPRPPRPPPLVLQFSEQPLQLLLLS